MEANPLRRVLAAKATAFVGLAMLVAVVLGIISVASVSTNSEAQRGGPPRSAFGAKQVIDANGPLPVSGNYTSKGGTLIILAAGSGWAPGPGGGMPANTVIGMRVRVDGTVEGTAEAYTNEAASHKAFVPATIVVRGLPAGPVPIVLEKAPGPTNTDNNDFFKVTVIELRPGS
jgi:hypothetical protein